jgi:lysophospholipase L1-like esterase
MNVNDLRICYFGDSIVAGAGDPEHRGWVGRAGAALHAAGRLHCAYNLGICGDASEQIARRWLAEACVRIPREHEGRVLFAFGANDVRLFAGRQWLLPEQSAFHARRILAESAARWPTLMVGPPPWANRNDEEKASTERSRATSAALAEAAAACGVPYLDLLSPLLASKVYMADIAATDGIHPGAAGYGEIARAVLGWANWWFPEAAAKI